MKTKLLSLAIVLSFISGLSNASHIVGIRITYEYTGSSTLFRLKMYRDCSGIPAPTSVQLCFNSASGCSPSINATLQMDVPNSGFEVPFNSCAGVGTTTCNGGSVFAFEEYNYMGIVVAPPCSDWVVSFSNCCRNAAITNLINPDFYSARVETTWDNLNYPTNSSPQFNAVPVNYYCAGIPAIIDYSAFDVDGDSLSYEFTPIDGGQCGNPDIMTFMAPFTYDQPLATLVPTVFDPVGGQILFTPSAIQIGVIGFRVNEYRNGVLIGSVRRDDEVVVVGGFVNPDTIAGRVYYDMNLNAIFDGGDIPANNVIVHMGPGNSYASSASNGKYNFQASSGTFNLTIPNPPSYMTLVPASHTVNATGTGIYYGNNDFALQPAPNINDLEVTINNNSTPVPGMNYPVVINYSNTGTTVQTNVEIIATLDPVLNYTSAIPAPVSVVGNVITWNLPSLGLFSGGIITIQTSVDTTAGIGDPVNCTVTISSSAIDQTASNNLDSFTDEVAASFDPNNKEVLPYGDIPLSFITSQQWLTYKINFQNLGTALAQTVKINDMLDFDLDLGTLEFVASSKPCTMTLQSPNQLGFNFFGINLPPASQNEPGSHGFVEYRIKPKSTVPLGGLITNNANIIFDFNAPIYTNLVHNKVVTSTGIYSTAGIDFNMTVFPNPANDVVTIQVLNNQQEVASIKLNNLLGEAVFETNVILKPGINELKVPVKELSTGMYFLSLYKLTGANTIKLLIQ